jgi:predicted nuclease of predicted toxin-antitoxin system
VVHVRDIDVASARDTVVIDAARSDDRVLISRLPIGTPNQSA